MSPKQANRLQGWKKLIMMAWGNFLHLVRNAASNRQTQLILVLCALVVLLLVPRLPLRLLGLSLLCGAYLVSYRNLNQCFVAKYGLLGYLRWWAIYSLLLTPVIAMVSAFLLLISGAPVTARHLGWWLLLGLFAGWVAKFFHALLEATEEKL